MDFYSKWEGLGKWMDIAKEWVNENYDKQRLVGKRNVVCKR